MTQDEIIEMAQECNLIGMRPHLDGIYSEALIAFAHLVAAKEREACAELVWPKLKIWTEEEQTAMGLAFNQAQEKHGWYETLMAVGASMLKMKAAAIRARGEQA